MNSLPRPRRLLAARILSAIVILPLLIAACAGGSSPLGGGSDPAAVVKDALSKVAAKDFDGVANLACAGQADEVRQQFDMAGQLASAVPGANAQDIVNSISFDTSGVTVGSATVNGDTATVPVSGTMKMNFDKEKLRPIIKQMLQAQGVGDQLTDEQIDTFLDQMTGGGQGVPLNESLTLKQEGGAWKICEPSSGGDGAAPSASAGS
jgi:hypothetical protein